VRPESSLVVPSNCTALLSSKDPFIIARMKHWLMCPKINHIVAEIHELTL
jgi:hypothetical protein